MKKGLLAVAIVLACALIGAGIATAAEVSTGGRIEWKITGGEDAATGLFGKGAVRVDYKVTLTSGKWETNISPRLDIAGGTVDECDAYIKYTSDMFALTLDPWLDNGMYDLYSATADDAPNIPENPGISVEIPFEPITLTLVVNNQEETENVQTGDVEIVWTDSNKNGEVDDKETTVTPATEAVGTGKLLFNYGLGVEYAMESLTLGLMVNSACKQAPWYGTSYGLKVEYDMAPMTFIGEYGSFSPSTDGYKSGSGYYVEFDYATDDMGTFLVSYTSSDKNFNGAGVPTPEAYSKIYGEWAYPLAESVTLYLDVTSEDKGLGAGAKSSYEAKVRVNF